MRLGVLVLFITAIIFGASPSRGSRELFLKVVGSVGEHVISSREVEASHLIDRAVFGSGAIKPVAVGESEFGSELNRLLIEWMVYEEAKVFNVAAVTDAEVNQSVLQVRQKMYAQTHLKQIWQRLGVSDAQLKDSVLRKLRANRFIKYKSNSSFVQVSDEEAREYFNKNRLKFGTLEFDKFKDVIKASLAKTNAESRLRDWFDILKKKHSVRNLMSETGRDVVP